MVVGVHGGPVWCLCICHFPFPFPFPFFSSLFFLKEIQMIGLREKGAGNEGEWCERARNGSERKGRGRKEGEAGLIGGFFLKRGKDYWACEFFFS